MGGFSKWPGHLPDVLHSYFGLAGFVHFQINKLIYLLIIDKQCVQ